MLENIEIKLLEKSKEAFLLAIELYNKPTIKYRVEGFSLFICNAWELMLKSYLIKSKGEKSIYFPDNPERTISLENAISKVFTNKKDPLRLNLEKILELRNISTHFITEEYEMVYVPLFQACILNYNEKMMAFHQVDMTKIIPQNFLTLSVSMKALDEAEIVAKYPEEIATKILTVKGAIDELSFQENDRFSIKIEHFHYLTKDKDKATSFVKIDSTSDVPTKIIRELKDPNNTHKYTAKSCIEKIRERLTRENVSILYNGLETKFNNYHFTNFCKHFQLKENDKFCYVHRQFSTPQYSYSQQVIDFIVEEIQKDPQHILDNIKK
ncbi:MAG: DUF3644 domain-containing protein [Clostridia bacterium]